MSPHPSVTMGHAAVQKLLSFWTAPSLVAPSLCLRDDSTAGAGVTIFPPFFFFFFFFFKKKKKRGPLRAGVLRFACSSGHGAQKKLRESRTPRRCARAGQRIRAVIPSFDRI